MIMIMIINYYSLCNDTVQMEGNIQYINNNNGRGDGGGKETVLAPG